MCMCVGDGLMSLNECREGVYECPCVHVHVGGGLYVCGGGLNVCMCVGVV